MRETPPSHRLSSRNAASGPSRNPDAWVIAQIHPREYKQLELGELMEFDQRKYGATKLIFYERPGD